MTRLVDRMASKSTLAECMTVFVDIMEYECVDEGVRPQVFRRAWAMLDGRGGQRPTRNKSHAPFSLFRFGACRETPFATTQRRLGF